jgi:predicted RND superfamily exporter protein
MPRLLEPMKFWRSFHRRTAYLWHRLVRFLAHHHELEYTALGVALVLCVFAVYASVTIKQHVDLSRELQAAGESSLQAEDFDLALEQFHQAEVAATFSLLNVTLNHDAAAKITETKRLMRSHEHFVAGLELFNHRNFDLAVLELRKG